MNKDYLLYQFKSRRYLLIFLLLIQILAAILPFLFTGMSKYTISLLASGFSYGILLIAICVLTPFFFNFVHSKKSVDTYFSLPLSRKSLLISTLLFEISAVYVPWLIANIIIAFLSIGIGGFSPGGFILMLTYALMITTALAVFCAAIDLLANNAIDGIIMIGGYFLLPLFLLLAANAFADIFVVGYNPFNFEIFGYLSLPFMACNAYFEMLNITWSSNYGSAFNVPYLDIIIIFIHLLVFAFVLYREFTTRAVERAEQNSDNLLAYPFLIYAYSFIFLFIFTSSTVFQQDFMAISSIAVSLFVYFFVFIFFMVAHFVYRRKIYINLKMVSFFVATIVLSFIFSQAAYLTRGFGLSENYPEALSSTRYTIGFTANRLEDSEFKNKISDYLDEIYGEDAYLDDHWSYFTISFSLDNEQKKDNEAALLMEELRKKAIDQFYDDLHNYNYDELIRINFLDDDNDYYNYDLTYTLDAETFDLLLKAADDFDVDGLYIPLSRIM